MQKNPLIILISADLEWQAIRQILPDAAEQISALGEWFEHTLPAGTHPPQSVIFFHGGWGKVAAAASTQYVIDRWQPRALVNLGTCGGFAGEVQRGEVLLVERTLIYDIYEQMGDQQAHIDHYTSEIDLSWLSPPYPQPVRRSLLVSGDRDLVVEEIPLLKQRYGAIAGDWESGAIAFVARRNQVRLLILRAVSDVVGPQGSEAYGDLAAFGQSAYEILDGLVANLPAWCERLDGPGAG